MEIQYWIPVGQDRHKNYFEIKGNCEPWIREHVGRFWVKEFKAKPQEQEIAEPDSLLEEYEKEGVEQEPKHKND